MLKRGLIILAVMAALGLAGALAIILNTDVREEEGMGGHMERVHVFGKLTAERNYDREGRLNGPTKLYFRNGNLRAEYDFAQGVRHGAAKIYDPEGNLHFEDTYDSGKRTARVEYDPAGKYVYLAPGEERALADFLGMQVFDFVNAYCELADRRRLVLKKHADESCIFLEPAGCAVHPAKPAQCRDFPVRWRTPRSFEYCEGMKALHLAV
jgi:Fe-S-cluster containining protein